MSLNLDALGYMLENAGAMKCPPTFLDKVTQRVVAAPKHGDDPSVIYRASSIGKPWITQVLDRWYGGKRQFTLSSCTSMLNGIMMEQVLVELLTTCGYKVEQQETHRGGDVVGHSDIILQTDVSDQRIVLECKSMAPHIVAGFANCPNDDFGYLSQLAFYWYTTRQAYPQYKVEAAFVLFNRGDSKFRLVEITQSSMEAKMRRLESALEGLAEVPDYDVDALLATVAIPKPILGKLPFMLMNSRWRDVLYRGTKDGFVAHDTATIARQLKQLPLQRSDTYGEA